MLQLKHSLKSLPNSQVALTITVDKQDIQKEYSSVLSENQKKVQIKGFRKGKVPVSVLEKKLKKYLISEATGNIMDQSFKQISDKLEQKPISQVIPDEESIDVEKINMDNDFEFILKYDVYPVFDIEDFKKIQITKNTCEIKKDDVNDMIERFRQDFSEQSDKEKNKKIEDNTVVVEEGDFVTLDYVQLENGLEVENTSFKNQVIEVGKKFNRLQLDDHIIGIKKGEEKIITIKYEEDFENKDLAGKEIQVKVKIERIRIKKLPEINDQFAKDVNEKYQTVKEMREDIESQLNTMSQNILNNKSVTELFDDIIEKAEIPVPQSMIESRLNNYINQLKNRFRNDDRQFQRFLNSQNKSVDDLKNEAKDGAVKEIKRELIIAKISETENIKSEDEDLNDWIEKNVPEKDREYYQKNIANNEQIKVSIDSQIIVEKTMKYIIDNMNVKKGKKVLYQELIKEQQQI